MSIDKAPAATGSTTPRIIQEDEYYSFGLRKPVGGYDYSNNNRYLYNGKEVQTDLADQYDYGARFYDPVIARWTSVDPLAEISRRWSLYNYVYSNPIRNVDPNGMAVEEINGGTRYTGEDASYAFMQLRSQFSNNNDEDDDRRKKTARDATSTASHVPKIQPRIKNNSQINIPPQDQGEIRAYPPPELVNYQDMGLRTNSLAIGQNVMTTFAGEYVAFKVGAAIAGLKAEKCSESE